MGKNRIHWIDICRGLGILLVIYGHGLNANSLRYLLYAFHMPLFFFLSGVVFHARSYENFEAFFIKSVKNLLIPYVFFALGSFVLWLLFFHSKDVTMHDALNQLESIVYANRRTLLSINNVLWFLPCLFMTRIIFFLLTKKSTGTFFLGGALFLLSIIGYIVSFYFPKTALPFGIEVLATTTVFYGLGFLWGRRKDESNSGTNLKTLFVTICLIGITVFFATSNYTASGLQVDIGLNRLNNYFYFYIASVAGIFACVGVSTFLKKNSIIEYVGKQSLLLLGWHMIVLSLIGKLFSRIELPLILKESRNGFMTIIFTLLATGSIILVSYLFSQASYLILKRFKQK